MVWWDRPVHVLIGNNQTYHVTRADTAAELLLDGWPDRSGPAFARAVVAIDMAVRHSENQDAQHVGRMAFEAAAREAGILLEPPQRA